VLITSDQDRQALLSDSPATPGSSRVSVLPNGVDLDYFKPDNSVMRQPATLVISGKMSYHANVSMVLHFIQEIMPLIWGQRPDVKVTVVGKDPPREIKDLEQNPLIRVTGTVKDIRPFLQEATLSVVPILYGAGIQNKVLEAMACATPVVSTPQAISALSLRPEQDILVAQKPDKFARVVLELLDDPARQREFGLAGRHYVESHHNWDHIAAHLEDIYEQCITRSGGISVNDRNRVGSIGNISI
jgi:glycosyltransferase involved in cell wall biosynthesis